MLRPGFAWCIKAKSSVIAAKIEYFIECGMQCDLLDNR